MSGAGGENRTPDLRITNALLYQLSYTGGKTVPLPQRFPMRNAARGQAFDYIGFGPLWPRQATFADQGAAGCSPFVKPNNASAPFHMIWTPMHSRMNDERRSTTARPPGPRNRVIRSA